MKCSTIRRFISLRIWLSVMFIPCLSGLYAQNDPACFQLFTPIVSAQPGDTVCVPLRVRDFDFIASAQFVVFYETSGLEYLHIDISNSVLPGILNNNLFHPATGGQVRFGWAHPLGLSVSAPDSSILFNMCFRVKNNANGFYPFTIGEQFPTLYEVVKEEQLGNPVRLPLVYQLGGIDTGNPSPGNLYLTEGCVQNAVCNQQTGSISLAAAGGIAPYTYSWEGPNGFTGSGSTLQHLAGGDYRATITDQSGASIICEVRVSIPGFFMDVDTTIDPAFCGLNNGCATLTVSGSNPSFTYQWSTGNNNTNSNCTLAPGQYTVTITNALGCEKVQVVTIPNDTTFTLNNDWVFIETCNGTADLEAVVFDAQGPFTYEWSNGANTAAIHQLNDGIYSVTATAAGGCTASSEYLVADISTQSWATTLQDHCDPGTGSLFITYNTSGTLSFPVLLSWSDGSTHLRQGPAAAGILDSLQEVPSGHYAVTITDANGCTIQLERTMNCFQPAPVPDGYSWIYIDADANPSDNCTGVYAHHFTGITRLDFSIQYPNGSALQEIKNLQLPGLSQNNFTINAADQTIGMSWQQGAPLNLSDDHLLFEVCLAPGFGQVEDELTFTNTPVPAAITTQDGPQIFLGRSGWIDYGMANPPALMACQAMGVAPSCAADGKAQILLGSCTPGEKLYGYFVVQYPNDSVAYFDNLSGLHFADGGIYQILVDRPDLSTESWFAAVPPIAPTEECVWPGDADNNQAVNHHDLLYIGLAYGKSGAARTDASLNWTGQDAVNWAESSAVRQVNFKNIDTNGDGQINAADTLALVQNWGKVINPARDNPFNAPLESNNQGQNPAINLETDTLYPGDAVHLPLSVGSQGTPMDNIYGLAFSISYDSEVVTDDIRFTPSASWFGQPGQYLCVQKNFPRQGRLDVAITRIDGVPVSGWGEIGDVFIIIEDNIFGIPAQDSIKNSKLFFSAISSSDIAETPKELGAQPVDLVIRKSGSVHTQEPIDRSITLAPNPAQDLLSVRSMGYGIRELRLLSANDGLQEIWYQGEPVSEVQKTVSHLPAGVYFVCIQTEGGVLLRKVVIRHE